MGPSSTNDKVQGLVKGIRSFFKWPTARRGKCGNVFTFTMPALPTTRIDIRQLPMVDQPDNCHLLQLPLELRERIYEHILGRLINFELLPGDFPGMSASIRTSWCYLPVDDLDRIPIHTMFRAESAALSPQFLLSCRQAYIEALPILHQRNTFRFPADYLATVVSGALGSYCLPDIRSVYLQSLYYSHDHGDPSNTVVTLLQQMNVSRLAFDFQFFPIPEPQSPWGRTVLEFRNLRRLEMWGDNQDVVSKFQQLMIGPGADEKYRRFLEDQETSKAAWSFFLRPVTLTSC